MILLLGILLVALKVTGIIAWPWLLVLVPFIYIGAVWLITFVLIIIAAVAGALR